jgi:hypothetical protein
VKRLMLVALSIEVGLVLIIIPWSAFWDRNYFATVIPPLLDIITNNFVRGAVSGVGLLNLIAGLMELVAMYTGRAGARQVSINSHFAKD